MNWSASTTSMGFPRLRIRGFEVANGWEDKEIRLPIQATSRAAGYDFFCAEDTHIDVSYPGTKPTLVPTGVKAYMREGEVLVLANRSSGPKNGLVLANGIGIVDADYYGNVGNDGHVFFAFWNVSDAPILLRKGVAIGQGVFLNYLLADGVRVTTERVGGFGSTDMK